ncbi:hypothetical protein TWF730_010602 [Orbilia blumenaviensis]|uniref:Uncharacterized protein n=1 Tax=Orbilia blumenaviensis TaxID=1796055 RepID=A0AAV9UNR0_9PEZI
MPHAHYTLIHKPQHRASKHTAWEKKFCTYCQPPNSSSPEAKSLPWEHYETICSNPFAIQILTDKTSLSRQAVLNSMLSANNNRKTAPKMVDPLSERATVVGRKAKGRKRSGRDYSDEMDLYQARLINCDSDLNFERDDVIWEEDGPTEDELVHGEYLKTVFPGFRAAVLSPRAVVGEPVSDEELRAMGLLYDSEDEHEHEHPMMGSVTPVSCTPFLRPVSPGSDSGDDMDELWEFVEDRRLPVEMRGEWDIVSEF